jgi:hypothetical protein
MPFEYIIWDLAEKFGWTIEYIENLSMAKLHEYEQVQLGKNEAKRSFFINPPPR